MFLYNFSSLLLDGGSEREHVCRAMVCGLVVHVVGVLANRHLCMDLVSGVDGVGMEMMLL